LSAERDKLVWALTQAVRNLDRSRNWLDDPDVQRRVKVYLPDDWDWDQAMGQLEETSLAVNATLHALGVGAET